MKTKTTHTGDSVFNPLSSNSTVLSWGAMNEENKKLKKACRDASRLIGMNEDEDSMEACSILDRAIK